MHEVVSKVVNSLAGDCIHFKSAFEVLPGPTLDLILSWEEIWEEDARLD